MYSEIRIVELARRTAASRANNERVHALQYRHAAGDTAGEAGIFRKHTLGSPPLACATQSYHLCKPVTDAHPRWSEVVIHLCRAEQCGRWFASSFLDSTERTLAISWGPEWMLR
jgi:hypothetical protein